MSGHACGNQSCDDGIQLYAYLWLTIKGSLRLLFLVKQPSSIQVVVQ